MSKNPINLALRFLLELVALFSVGFWGYHQAEGWISLALAVGIPVLYSVVWGVFAVPNDPSRSGKTIVATPGLIRLIIEFAVFASGVWALWDMGSENLSWIFAMLVLAHYGISYDRIFWLLRQK